MARKTKRAKLLLTKEQRTQLERLSKSRKVRLTPIFDKHTPNEVFSGAAIH